MVERVEDFHERCCHGQAGKYQQEEFYQFSESKDNGNEENLDIRIGGSNLRFDSKPYLFVFGWFYTRIDSEDNAGS